MNILNFLSSFLQFWDFHPDVGLIVAGGNSPASKEVYISKDYGKTNSLLTNLPYGSYNYVSGGCLVIVNSTTVFVAGGYGEY